MGRVCHPVSEQIARQVTRLTNKLPTDNHIVPNVEIAAKYSRHLIWWHLKISAVQPSLHDAQEQLVTPALTRFNSQRRRPFSVRII